MVEGNSPQNCLYRFESDTGVNNYFGQLSERFMYESAKLVKAVRLRHCPHKLGQWQMWSLRKSEKLEEPDRNGSGPHFN